jgi:hypothetical protein
LPSIWGEFSSDIDLTQSPTVWQGLWNRNPIFTSNLAICLRVSRFPWIWVSHEVSPQGFKLSTTSFTSQLHQQEGNIQYPAELHR